MNWLAASAKANVLTASSRPRTRSAPRPMTAARAAVITAASTIERLKGSGWTPAANSWLLPRPTLTLMPRCRAAARKAPMPAKAIWPNDSWPNHPVSTVSDNPHRAKTRMVV